MGAFAANVSSLDALVERVHSLQSSIPPANGHCEGVAQQGGHALHANEDRLALQPPSGATSDMSVTAVAMDPLVWGQRHAASQELNGAATAAGWEAAAKALSAGSGRKTGAEEWLVTSSDDGTGPASHPCKPCLSPLDSRHLKVISGTGRCPRKSAIYDP